MAFLEEVKNNEAGPAAPTFQRAESEISDINDADVPLSQLNLNRAPPSQPVVEMDEAQAKERFPSPSTLARTSADYAAAQREHRAQSTIAAVAAAPANPTPSSAMAMNVDDPVEQAKEGQNDQSMGGETPVGAPPGAQTNGPAYNTPTAQAASENGTANKRGQSINVTIRDPNGYVVNFLVKPKTKIHKIFKTYGDKFGIDLSTLRFISSEGHVLSKNDTTITPEMLGFEDGEIIDVALEQVGGHVFDEAENRIMFFGLVCDAIMRATRLPFSFHIANSPKVNNTFIE